MTKNNRKTMRWREWTSWASAIGAGAIAGTCAEMFVTPQPLAADVRSVPSVAARADSSARTASTNPTPSVSLPQDAIGPFELTVEPAATVAASNGRQQLRAQARINNRFGKRAAFTITQALVDSRGQLIAGPTMLNAVAVAAGGRSAQAFSSPDALPDGHYKWRVTAAGSDGVIDSVLESEAYFSVKAGSITPLDANEWYALPEVNMANGG